MPHIPAPITAILETLGIAVPPSGVFKRRVLNDRLMRKRVAPGRRAHLFAELDRANLLVDDRHFQKGTSK
jgi:hypothetical protein